MYMAAVLCVLLLAGGAFVITRQLSGESLFGQMGGGGRVKIASGDGKVVDAEYVPSDKLPISSPDVSGAYERRQDNSFFIDETEGGFFLSKNDDGTISVANATGNIREVVVTHDTLVYVDVTLEDIDDPVAADGKVYQTVRPGTVEEIGELSWVVAWGETRGDRLIADLLLYRRPPVLNK
jgi:hypothetical protein